MSDNPYQPPVDQPATEHSVRPESVGVSVLLIALCILVVLHLFMSIGLAVLGLAVGNPVGLVSGIVLIGFYIAIFVGLLLRQEWARLNLIWLCYVGIVAYLAQIYLITWVAVPLIGFEAATLVLAHSPGIRGLTRKHSLAETYVYSDSEEQAGEGLDERRHSTV